MSKQGAVILGQDPAAFLESLATAFRAGRIRSFAVHTVNDLEQVGNGMYVSPKGGANEFRRLGNAALDFADRAAASAVDVPKNLRS